LRGVVPFLVPAYHRRIGLKRTSENPLKAKFGEGLFHILGWIRITSSRYLACYAGLAAYEGADAQGGTGRALRRKHHGEQYHHGAHDQRQPGDGPGYLLVLLIGGAYGKMGLAYPPPLLPDPLPGGAPLSNANHVSNERSENALVSLSQNFGELPFHAIG
jgi:hypothetical protein